MDAKSNPGLGYVGAAALDPDVTVVPGRALAVIATVAGNVSVLFSNGSKLVVPVAVGLTTLPFAAKAVLSADTTATATYAILR